MVYLKVEHPDSSKITSHKDFDKCVKVPGENLSFLVPKYIYNDVFGDSQLDTEIKSAENIVQKDSDHSDVINFISLMKRVRQDGGSKQ